MTRFLLLNVILLLLQNGHGYDETNFDKALLKSRQSKGGTLVGKQEQR